MSVPPLNDDLIKPINQALFDQTLKHAPLTYTPIKPCISNACMRLS
jgi:hypothetical protein